MPEFKKTLLVLSIILISACSPHPGTGTWLAENNKAEISKLVVNYDGKAEIYLNDSKKAEWHCFWAGLDKKELSLTCTPASNPDNEESFSLKLDKTNDSSPPQTSKKQAKLFRKAELQALLELEGRK